jgi:FlaG/FlaF family flagellin (archaellin)
MVAVTVALVALVTVIVFDIGGDVSESPDATVELSTDGDAGEVTATVLRNENVDSMTVRESTDDDGTNPASATIDPADAGETAVLQTSGDLDSGSGTVQVIAVMSDGSEQVLTTTDYSGF